MKKLGVDVMITGSQKALACPPGISVIVLSQEAIERVNRNEVKCMYLDLKNALKMEKEVRHLLPQQLEFLDRLMLD